MRGQLCVYMGLRMMSDGESVWLTEAWGNLLAPVKWLSDGAGSLIDVSDHSKVTFIAPGGIPILPVNPVSSTDSRKVRGQFFTTIEIDLSGMFDKPFKVSGKHIPGTIFKFDTAHGELLLLKTDTAEVVYSPTWAKSNNPVGAEWGSAVVQVGELCAIAHHSILNPEAEPPLSPVVTASISEIQRLCKIMQSSAVYSSVSVDKPKATMPMQELLRNAVGILCFHKEVDTP